MRKCVLCHANNKGADQPVHPHSLISAFVVRCLDIIISRFCSQNFKTLASFCGCAGRFVWPGRKLPKTCFVVSGRGSNDK